MKKEEPCPDTAPLEALQLSGIAPTRQLPGKHKTQTSGHGRRLGRSAETVTHLHMLFTQAFSSTQRRRREHLTTEKGQQKIQIVC